MSRKKILIYTNGLYFFGEYIANFFSEALDVSCIDFDSREENCRDVDREEENYSIVLPIRKTKSGNQMQNRRPHNAPIPGRNY